VAKAVSVRLDDDALRALARLEAAGLSRSQAIRVALIETADRRQRAAELSNEAAAVAADVDDRREMARVASVMEDLRDTW
jgi:antitoxin component of RelBE/YafQ-DinJ toxin-antitoxin module